MTAARRQSRGVRQRSCTDRGKAFHSDATYAGDQNDHVTSATAWMLLRKNVARSHDNDVNP